MKPDNFSFLTSSGHRIYVRPTAGVNIWEEVESQSIIGFEPAHHWYEFSYPALAVPPSLPEKMALIGVGCNMIGKLTQKIHALEVAPGKWEAPKFECNLVDTEILPGITEDETFKVHKMDGIEYLKQFPEGYFDYVCLDPYPIGQVTIDPRFVTSEFSEVIKCAKRWSIMLLKTEQNNDTWREATKFQANWRMQSFKQFRAHFIPFFTRRVGE